MSSLFESVFTLVLRNTPFLTRIEKLTMGPGDESIAANTLLMPSVAMDGISIAATVFSLELLPLSTWVLSLRAPCGR